MAVSRAAGEGLWEWRFLRGEKRTRRLSRLTASARLDPAVEPDGPTEPPRLVVKEPAKLKGSLVEKGLAWQETFDFGKGGARAFQLPSVGLLQAPPATELKRTREELEANAQTLQKKREDF